MNLGWSVIQFRWMESRHGTLVLNQVELIDEIFNPEGAHAQWARPSHPPRLVGRTLWAVLGDDQVPAWYWYSWNYVLIFVYQRGPNCHPCMMGIGYELYLGPVHYRKALVPKSQVMLVMHQLHVCFHEGHFWRYGIQVDIFMDYCSQRVVLSPCPSINFCLCPSWLPYQRGSISIDILAWWVKNINATLGLGTISRHWSQTHMPPSKLHVCFDEGHFWRYVIQVYIFMEYCSQPVICRIKRGGVGYMGAGWVKSAC